MKIYFMRHGQTNYNLLRFCNDDPTKDVHLTDLWKQQAENTAIQCNWLVFDKVFVSMLPRAIETAKIVLKNSTLKSDMQIELAISDRKTGYDGKSADEFWEKLWENKFNAKLPGGESYQEVKNRVLSF